MHNPYKWQQGIATMYIGYARVSTKDQENDTQITALKNAGCELYFYETASGGRWNRPELHKMLDQLRKNDVVVVWKLDRLSRSLKDMILILEKIKDKKASFLSLTENIDTSTPAGRMMMQMVASFAEFEREMLKERTSVGLEAAKINGRVGGRRSKLTVQQQQEIISTVNSGSKTAADMARLFCVHPSTIARLLNRNTGTQFNMAD